MTSLLLVFVTAISIFLGVWLYKVLKYLGNYTAFLIAIKEEIKDYDAHLEAIHEMERFYGDEDLKSLINHTKSLKNYLESFNIDEDK